MKKGFLIGVVSVFSSVVLWSSAIAADSGIYVGAHAGGAVESFSDRSIEGKANGYTDKWSQKRESAGVFGAGAVLGYDFDPLFSVPVRLELDFTARSKSNAESSASWSEDLDWLDRYLDEKYGPDYDAWKSAHKGWIDDGLSWTGDGDLRLRSKKKDRIDLKTLMLNSWFDIPTGTSLTPYLGGGIGIAFVNYKPSYSISSGTETLSWSESETKKNFAWSLGGGLAYDFLDNWTADLGYRFINAGRVEVDDDVPVSLYGLDIGEIKGKSKTKVQVHDISLGIRYTF